MTPLSISRAWEETTTFVARETRLIVPLALALIALPAVIFGLAAPDVTNEVAARSPGLMALMLAQFLIGAVGQLAIARLALGHRERLGEAIRHGAARLPALVGGFLVVGLPLGFVLALIVGAAAVVGKAGAGAGKAGAALILLALMTALFVAMLIIFARCLLMLPLASVEAGGPLRLIKRSFAVSRGEVLRLLGAAALFLVGGVVILIAVRSVVGALVIVALGKPEAWTVSALLIALVDGAMQALIGTVFTIFTARLYAQRSGEAGPETGVPSSAT